MEATDDEAEQAGMTVLNSDTDSWLFSSEGDPQERMKTYEKPDMNTEETEQWKLVTNPRQEKRRKRRSAKAKEANTTKTVTKTTNANDGKMTMTENTRQRNVPSREDHTTQMDTTADKHAKNKTQQTNINHEERKEGTNNNTTKTKESTTTTMEAKEPLSAYANEYRPVREDRTVDRAVEELTVKEAKFFLRIYPRNRSQFNPNIAFAEFFRVIHEIDADAMICPFDKNSPRPILFHTDNLPQNKERLHYLSSMRERNGAWSCVVRILTEVDDWKLLASSQMRIFLNYTGMQATKQELDSPNLANAGWFMGLHPQLTNRKSMKKRIQQNMPEQKKIPFEIRGGDVYLPKGIGHPRDPNRRQKVKALQVYCDISDVAQLQQAIIGMVRPENSLGEQFIRYAGWIATYPNDEMQSWIDNQRELVQYAARQPLCFISLKGKIDVPITMYDGEITTVKKWFEEQKEFCTKAGLLQVETGRHQDKEATVVYLKHARGLAKANMEMLITRLQKQISDESRATVFSPITHATTPRPQEIDTMAKEAYQYYHKRKRRAERKEAYELKKDKTAGAPGSLFLKKQTTENQYWTAGTQQHQEKTYANTVSNTNKWDYLYHEVPTGPKRTVLEDSNAKPQNRQGKPEQSSQQQGQPERPLPTKQEKMEEMISTMESRLTEISNNTSTALQRIDHLEDTLHKTVEQSLKLAEEVKTISSTVAKLPEGMMQTLTTAIKETEAKRDEEIDKLERQHLSILEDQRIADKGIITMARETAKCVRRMEEINASMNQLEDRMTNQEKGAPPTTIEEHHKTIKEMKKDIQALGKELYENEDPYTTKGDTNGLLKNAAGISSVMVKKGFKAFIKTVGKRKENKRKYCEEEDSDSDEGDYEPYKDVSEDQNQFYTSLADKMKATIQRRTQQYIETGDKDTPTLYQNTPRENRQDNSTAGIESNIPETQERTLNKRELTETTNSSRTTQPLQETADSVAQIAADLADSMGETDEESVNQTECKVDEEHSPFDEDRTQSENRQVSANTLARSVSPVKPMRLAKGQAATAQKTTPSRRSTRLAAQSQKNGNPTTTNNRQPLRILNQTVKSSKNGGQAQ